MNDGQTTPLFLLEKVDGDDVAERSDSPFNSDKTSVSNRTSPGQPKSSDNRPPVLLLFDGNAIVHRAFHAIQPLTVSRTGEVVNAVYGFTATLLKVVGEISPTYWGIAFDRPAPTFRHQIFESYKEQRPPVPEDLRGQIERVRQVAAAFGIPQFEVDGFEADDVLATIATQASKLGIETIIVTGDADMLQLVSPNVKVLYPKRTFSEPVMFDEAGVREKYGLSPSQLADFKALVGDISDNIPNIRGIGEKTAAALLRQFGSIEAIYQN
ncbi:MAG: hypothetical protein N3E40_02775, partial [Dehalococcoidia bacterium]|nr:hypothetical protein [Dehalococcoidia bacterium]